MKKIAATLQQIFAALLQQMFAGKLICIRKMNICCNIAAIICKKSYFSVRECFDSIMCLLFVYLNDEESSDGYRLILVNNRDEEWDRPTKQLQFWTDHTDCISGLDQTPRKEGGTWLGASKTGRIGILLNILGINDPRKKGRGYLVNGFISSKQTGENYIKETFTQQSKSSDYNSFNLILMDLSLPKSSGVYCTNLDGDITVKDISNGILTSDNSSPDKPWQKSVQNRDRFDNIVKRYNKKETKEKLVEELLCLLGDKKPFEDDQQVAKQAAMSNMDENTTRERSAAFVWTPNLRYGTRTHSIILVDTDGHCEFIEKTMKTPVSQNNVEWETTAFNFKFHNTNDTTSHL